MPPPGLAVNGNARLSFHDALEIVVHEQFLELGDETTLIDAAKRAGLELEKFRADWHDRQLAEAAMSYHNQAVENHASVMNN
jgi:predicted DsbA family dithiol-disulfide isomerase